MLYQHQAGRAMRGFLHGFLTLVAVLGVSSAAHTLELDRTLGGTGFVYAARSDTGGVAIALQSDGKILSVGRTSGSLTLVVARFETDGGRDGTFGTDGLVQLFAAP